MAMMISSDLTSRPVSPGAVAGAPLLALRLEGATVFLMALAGFVWLGGSWRLGLLLFLAPDVSMLAYLAGARMGAFAYNLAHTYVLPLLLAAAAWDAEHRLAGALACLWIMHIGFDRALGYGLKYPTAFGDTHLGRVGRQSV